MNKSTTQNPVMRTSTARLALWVVGTALGLGMGWNWGEAQAQAKPSTKTQAQAQIKASPWIQIGREATPAEIRAWDIDVRPDFKGLPKGAGSVDLGQQVWDGKCASCHGVFGESNEVFAPIIGGTTADDIRTGRVKGLEEGKSIVPQKTTIMKVATISTLFDYINRAMPWNAPKTLKTDEVYGVLAYMLNLANIVPADFSLSDGNIAEVQKRMPNRNGMVHHEPLWRTDGKGDVNNTACMENCAVDVAIRSSLPGFARDAHGNLAEQNRLVGPVRGVNTLAANQADKPAAVAAAPTQTSPQSAEATSNLKSLLTSNACLACHGYKGKIVGPGFNEIASKYAGDTRADLKTYLANKILAGGVGVFGTVPMPPQPQLSEKDSQAIAEWLASGAR